MALSYIGNGWLVDDGQVIYFPDDDEYCGNGGESFSRFVNYDALRIAIKMYEDGVPRKRVVVYPFYRLFKSPGKGQFIWIDTLSPIYDSNENTEFKDVGPTMMLVRDKGIDRAIAGYNKWSDSHVR